MSSVAVRGLSADSYRLEVQMHWRLYHGSWSTSENWEAYECQPSDILFSTHL